MAGGTDFAQHAAHALSREPGDVLISTRDALAFVTKGGWLSVSWPATNGGLMEQGLARYGTRDAPQGIAPCALDGAVRHEIAVPLVGDAESRRYAGAAHVVLRHRCPVTRHTWLGPWEDGGAAERVAAAVREHLGLPRELVDVARLTTEAELARDALRYHGNLVSVEGRWRPEFDETPDFIAESTLVFPPDFVAPDRETRLRVEGLWIVRSRPDEATLEAERELYARDCVYVPGGADHRPNLPLGDLPPWALPSPRRISLRAPRCTTLRSCDVTSVREEVAPDVGVSPAELWRHTEDCAHAPARLRGARP